MASILPTEVKFICTAGDLALLPSSQTDSWCDFLHLAHSPSLSSRTLRRYALCWGRGSKGLLSLVSFLSVISVILLQFCAQWLRESQNTENGPYFFVAFHAGPADFGCTWRVVAVEVLPDRLEDSPRIFYVVRAPSTSSPKKVINWRMSPSEMPSRLVWTIQRRHMSSAKARSIFVASTLPYPFTSSPSARSAWMRRLLYVRRVKCLWCIVFDGRYVLHIIRVDLDNPIFVTIAWFKNFPSLHMFQRPRQYPRPSALVPLLGNAAEICAYWLFLDMGRRQWTA